MAMLHKPSIQQSRYNVLTHSLTVILIIALVLASFSPFIGLRSDTPQAYAASNSVYLSKIGNIHYTDGHWNAHIFRANDGNGETVAYCVEPEKNSPPEGTYTKADINCVSNRNLELRADLWFVYGGPGFDRSMWPSTNWDGNPISNDDIYLASHILLSDTYVSNLYEATYGAGQRFRDWISWYVTGYDINTGKLINDGAVGRQALHRMGEVSPRFEVYQIYGGSNQNIATSSYYRPYGNIRIDKDSSSPEITNGNPNYSMKGIKYGIYTQNDCNESSNTGKELVLDENGCAEVRDLLEGTYYIREKQDSVSGSGYAYNSTIYSCEVIGDQTSVVQTKLGELQNSGVYNTPITDIPGIIVQKYDVLTQSTVPSGDANMSEALFEVKFFANNSGSTSGNPTRTWVFRTDSDGKIDLKNNERNAFVSGDALYRDPSSGVVIFPLGTYATKELSAPASYEPVRDAKTTVCVLQATGTNAHDTNNTAFSNGGIRQDEVPIRHDLMFTKKDYDTQRPMANIPFLVSRVLEDGTIAERHVVVTDANGTFNSSVSHAYHSTRTNANDKAVSKRSDDSYVVDESKLDPDAGIWFGNAKNGAWIAPNDEYGAFPDSTSCKYIFKELPVKANEGKALVYFEAYAHAAQSTQIDLGTIQNTTPTLATIAVDKLDGDKLVSRNTNSQVTDTVSYGGLVAGQTYRIEGKLVNAGTGEILYDRDGNESTSSVTFTTSATSGTTELSFTFDATTVEDDTRIVVCENLYEDTRLLATHEDLNDSSQTITVVQPQLSTTALDAVDGDSQIIGDINAKITDCVRYSGLTPGEEYTLTALLMDQATEQPFHTPNGPVTANVTFTAKESSGSQDISLVFDASGLDPDTKLVVFERLTQNNIDIASHEDIHDSNQTVTVVPPALNTQAWDPEDGDSIIAADTSSSITDTVSYEGLTPGYQYQLIATLVNKETGEAIIDANNHAVTATHSFTPVERNGSTDVLITFDASNITITQEVVVFEELYRDDRYITNHIDINSASQTVVIEPPSIQTYASSDGTSKEIMRDADITLLDTVSYKNLKPGNNYTIIGTIMDKQTGEALLDNNGASISESISFVPEASEGSVTVSFLIDSLNLEEGAQLVVFEQLYKDDTKLVAHEDIEDVRQTVTIKQPTISTTATSKDDTKTVVRDTNSIIIDSVAYSGLAPNKEYKLVGTVMEKATNEPLHDSSGNLVTAEASFTPDLANGVAQLSFSFNASNLEDGAELVVFEKLYRNETEIAAHEDINDESQTVTITPCNIMTLASDPNDGDKIISAFEHSQILDSVTYEGLEAGAEYEFVGKLMDKSTQAPVYTTQGESVQTHKSFAPSSSNGVVDVAFDFDASNSETVQEAVIFQELYRDGELIATHADYDNSAQTVTLAAPAVETNAVDGSDGDKEIAEDSLVTIVDTVTYSGLIAGEEYELDGTLMIDNGTLEGVPVYDAFGNPISAHISFTAEASHGTVDVPFELDTTLLEKEAHVVVFEKLFHERTLIAEHANIQDKNQTVYLPQSLPTKLAELIPDDPNPLASFGNVAKMGDCTAYTIMICSLIGMLSFGILAILRRKAFGSHHENE